MTVTVEVINPKTFDLLRAIEGLGLIHVNPPVPPQTEEMAVHEKPPPYRWLRGCSKGGRTVEDFLAECRADKEHELEIERRQEEERARLAKLHT